MVQHGEGLRILYTVFPCTQVFRFDPFYPTGAFHEFSWCYNNTAQVRYCKSCHQFPSSNITVAHCMSGSHKVSVLTQICIGNAFQLHLLRTHL